MSLTHRPEGGGDGCGPAPPATLLHAGLVLLDRGSWKKLGGGPLTPDMFARPNSKGLAVALYLLYSRVHGKSRAVRDLRHCWPLAESQSQRDFRTAMHAWIKALGSEGRLPPDAVRFFPTAYQTACGPRTIELLGALCALALEAEAQRCFPGAIDDVPPDHTDDAALTSSWGLHQAVAEGRRHREAASLSSLLATLQRLQEVWEASTARAGTAGRATAAEPGRHLWSRSAAHTGRVATLQQVFDLGLPLSDRPDAATGTAVGALLLGEQLDLAAGERAAPSLAGEARPEGVLHCLQLRLIAAVQRLQACASDGVPGSQQELQVALTELQQVYGAITEVSQQALAATKALNSPASVLRLLPPSPPPVNPMAVCQASLAAQAPEQPRSLFAVAAESQQQLGDDVRQQVWDAVQCMAAAVVEMSSSGGSQGGQEWQGQEPCSTPACMGRSPALQQDVAGSHLERSTREASGTFSPSLADLVGNGPVQELDSVDIDAALGDGDMPSPSGSCTASHQHRPQRQPQQPAASASEESCASFSLNVGGSGCLPPLHGRAGRTGPSCISPMASVAGGSSSSYVRPAALQQERRQHEAGSSRLGGGTTAVAPMGALLFANSHAQQQQQQGYAGSPATTNGYTPPKCLDSPGPRAAQQQPHASPFASSSSSDATPSSKFSGKRSPLVPSLALPIHSPGQRLASASLPAQKNLRTSVLKSQAKATALLAADDEGTPHASPRIRSAKVTTTSSGCSMESPRQQRLRHAVSEAIDTAEAARSLHAAERNAASSPLSAAAAADLIDSLAADSTPMSGRRRSGRITSTPLPMPPLGSPGPGGSGGSWVVQAGSAVHRPPLRLDSPAASVAAASTATLPKRIDSPAASAPPREQSQSALRERCNSMSMTLTASVAAGADFGALEARFQKLKRGGGGTTRPVPLS